MDVREIGTEVILFLLGWALALGCTPRGAADPAWGEPSGGFRSRIWTERPPARPGDPVVVHYEIQNVGAKKATVWHSGFWPNHRIDATTLEGEAVEPTPAGASLRAAFDPQGPREKHAGRNLEPGEIDSAWEPVDVGGLFVLPAGGFRIQIVYQQGRMRPVESNVLVVAAPAP